jgi:thioredoxin 1
VLGPILKEVKDNLGDGISIIKNRCQNQEIASKYQVRGVPTMILFKAETVVARIRCFDKNAIIKVKS